MSAISPLLSAPPNTDPLLMPSSEESEPELQFGVAGWGDCVTLLGRMLAQPPLYQRAVDNHSGGGGEGGLAVDSFSRPLDRRKGYRV